MMAFMSNMLVGSSRSSKSGREKRALAKANLILQPPENVRVAFCCISLVKPKPFRIMEALAGALSASMFCNWA